MLAQKENGLASEVRTMFSPQKTIVAAGVDSRCGRDLARDRRATRRPGHRDDSQAAERADQGRVAGLALLRARRRGAHT
jgi:hypothetical protein